MVAAQYPFGDSPEGKALQELPKKPDGWVDWERVNEADIPLPQDDDLGIPSDDSDLEEEAPQLDESLANVLVVDGLPEVEKEKFDKLMGVVRKIFSQVGNLINEGVTMPFDQAQQKSKGFAFIEFASADEASSAQEQADGYKIDKNHTLRVNLFPDLERYAQVPEEYQPPNTQAFSPVEGLSSWLLDPRGRDQFAIRYQDMTEIHWNDGPQAKDEEVYKRSNWTESYVMWSPKGNYIATIHRQGVALWGTSSFSRLQRFTHQGVQFIQFSPGEKFIVTCSTAEAQKKGESSKVTITVFELRSGRKLRTFEGTLPEFSGADGNLQWPIFKWSGDGEDRFLARLSKDAISVYETPHMGLLHKKSLKLPGVLDFDFSPTASLLAAFMPEKGNSPARIALISLPEREEVRQKNLFSVSEVRLHWHPQGTYFAAKVLRLTKTKKTTYTSFELFRIQEPQVPMEVMELDNNKDKVVDIAWEPQGHRLAILHGDSSKPSLSIYSMKPDKKAVTSKVVKVGTYPNKNANKLVWSPRGRHLVLAGLKPLSGQLEFFNADDGETMATSEHLMCTDVDWDPTGRYVATSVTSMHDMENGFNMWTFHGKLLYKRSKEMFLQFSWRPRPPSLLPEEQKDQIWRNLKKYAKRFEEEDEQLKAQADTSALSEKQRQFDEWCQLQRQWRAWLESDEYKRELNRITAHLPPLEEPEEERSMEVEEVLEIKEEPVE